MNHSDLSGLLATNEELFDAINLAGSNEVLRRVWQRGYVGKVPAAETLWEVVHEIQEELIMAPIAGTA